MEKGNPMDITIEEARMQFPAIGENLLGGLYRYSEDKIPTGSFMRAVLTNDLFGALGKYSGNSFDELNQLFTLMYNYMPSNQYGSKDKVNGWLGK